MGEDARVLIVGAGPTGLVLALWLRRLGIPARIVDRDAAPGTSSRALAVQVRTLEFYRQLGIADRVIAAGVKIDGLNFWVGGGRVARVPFHDIGLGLTPYPFVLVYPQDAHERMLIDHLRTLDVEVEHGVELIDFTQSGAEGGARVDGPTGNDGVNAALRHADGREERLRVDFLAGCDGASSTVRERLGIGFPGGTYEGLFYVADVDVAGQAADGELHVDLERSDFVLLFPLKGTGEARRVRLVGAVRGASRDGAGEALDFQDVRGRAIDELGLDVREVNWFSTYKVHHRVASSFREGRVLLLGDAAHVHSPVGGQGMNTGIGDAVNLAWKLADVLAGRAGDDLLDTYALEREAFARRLVATTDRVFEFVTRSGAFARFVRTRLVPLLAPRLMRLAPLRRFLFLTASQTGIRYPDSGLSRGKAGAVSGGDRLPWSPATEGTDNYAPLASLSWQVHVYGEPAGELHRVCAALGLPLHVFEWQPSRAHAGFARGAAYLIRPDGYVALAGADGAGLREYMRRLRGIGAADPMESTSTTSGS